MRFLLALILLAPAFLRGTAPEPECVYIQKALNPTPYLVTNGHPLKPTLDTLFANPKTLRYSKAFSRAGFVTRVFRPRASMRVAEHPATPGYLFKVYLSSETPLGQSNVRKRLIRRAIEADRTRKFIKRHKIRHFTVPRKWIYQPKNSKNIVLVVEDMQLVSRPKCAQAWKTKVTKSHLKELYALLSHGFGSLALKINIAYTKNGNFAFVDTEFPPRKFHLYRVEKFLSPKMQQEWQRLIR